ncbi:major Facilitator Superfamily protein, partial [Vibrio parahaemolyticus V-223/04]
CLRLCLVCLTR